MFTAIWIKFLTVCLESKVGALSAKILGHVNHEHRVHGFILVSPGL